MRKERIALTIDETIEQVMRHKAKIEYDFFENPRFRIGNDSIRKDAVFKLLYRYNSVKVEQHNWHSGCIYQKEQEH